MPRWDRAALALQPVRLERSDRGRTSVDGRRVRPPEVAGAPVHLRHRPRLVLPLRRHGARLRGRLAPDAEPGLRPHGVRHHHRAGGLHGRPRAGQLSLRPSRRAIPRPDPGLRVARDRHRHLLRAHSRPRLAGVFRLPGTLPRAERLVRDLRVRPVLARLRAPPPAHDADGRHPPDPEPGPRQAGGRDRANGRGPVRDEHLRRGGRGDPGRLWAPSRTRESEHALDRGGDQPRGRARRDCLQPELPGFGASSRSPAGPLARLPRRHVLSDSRSRAMAHRRRPGYLRGRLHDLRGGVDARAGPRDRRLDLRLHRHAGGLPPGHCRGAPRCTRCGGARGAPRRAPSR